MTEILNQLTEQLYSGAEFLLIYNSKVLSFNGSYKWTEYDFYDTDNELTVSYLNAEVTINLDDIKDVEYDPDDDEYILTFNDGATALFGILN